MTSRGRWIIRYADGSTFSYLDGTPLDAPKDGVLWIAQGESRPLAGQSYFVYDTDQKCFFNCDFNGREARLRTRPLKTICFNGEQIPDDDWALIRKEMRNPW